jgi:hypothetical protein
VLRNFHLMANTFYGAGNGRYIAALGPDAIVKADGTLSPLHSGSGVAGSEYQVTPRFEFDTYYSCPYFHSTTPECDGVSGFTCVGFPGSANTNNSHFRKGPSGLPRRSWGARTTGSCNS